MQRLRDKRKDLRSSFMSHFLACDDKSCTRLNDLLDRIFFEGKARHVMQTYVGVKSLLCTLMGVYSHYYAHLCACKVIIMHTYGRVQSLLCTLMWV